MTDSPPLPVTATVRRDFASGSTQVTLESGRSVTVSDLSGVLRSAALDAPLAVILDVNGLVARDVVAIGPLLPAPAGPESVAPVVLSVNPLTPGGRMARAVLSDYALICDSATSASAVAREIAAMMPREHAHLPAAPTSPGDARRLVASACRAWGLDQVTEAAMVVASELVSNSVEHAGTDLDVGVSIGGEGVRIGVRDRTLEPPQLSGPRAAADASGPLHLRSRGLSIVSALAADWGFVTCGDGKTVWATIRAPARATSDALSAVTGTTRRPEQA